jgi:hypothetical protein
MKAGKKLTIMSLLIFTATTGYGIYQSSVGVYTDQKVLWSVVGITTLFSVGVYIIQSFYLPTTSEQGQMNSEDILKGCIVAVGNVIGSIIAANATETAINWPGMLSAVGAVVVGYIIKQVKSEPAPAN